MPHSRHLTRREALALGPVAAASLVAVPAAAIPPPVASKHTSAVLLTSADLTRVHTLVERTNGFREGSPANGVAFSPDGKLAAVGGSHAFAAVWDVAAGKPAIKLGEAAALAFRPTGEVVTADVGNSDPSSRGACVAWTLGRKEPAELFTFRLERVVFSADGRFLAGPTFPSKRDAATLVLSVADGTEVFRVPHASTVFAVAGGRVVGGKWPAKAGGVWTVRVWGQDGRAVAEIEGAPPVAGNDAVVVLRGTDPAEVVVWNPVARTRAVLRHRHAELTAVGISADGKKVATAGPLKVPPGEVTYGISPSQVAQVVTVRDAATGKEGASAEVGNVRFQWLAFSPDAKQLLAAGSENVMR
ncbi:WD40 repeat domain-containing protein [Gemmata sp.]|uniref:WD40 repeat domain-containing protein n=1 Tax=Gemmata sp. TaxID=1914242 RepID=UPI003F718CB4